MDRHEGHPLGVVGASLVLVCALLVGACTFDLSLPSDGVLANADAGADVPLDVSEDGWDGSAESDSAGNSCIVLNAAPPRPTNAQSMTSDIAPPIGGEFAIDDLQVLLRENTQPQKTGVFDLSVGNDTNYATCDHCLLLREDVNESGIPAKTYFPRSGKVTVNSVTSPPTPAFFMRLEDVEFVQVTIEPKTSLSVPVESETCFRIVLADWDTQDRTDTECADTASCMGCCEAYHPEGLAEIGASLQGCACDDSVCLESCKDSFCGSSGSPSGSSNCASCITSAVALDGACYSVLSETCGFGTDCRRLLSCYSSCQ